MSTSHGLTCRTHTPNLSERLDGFHNDYGVTKLRDLWRFRDVLLPAVRIFNGEQIDDRPKAMLIGGVGDPYEQRALSWIASHARCDVAIVDEYGDIIELAP